jgi:hypothetical protein
MTTPMSPTIEDNDAHRLMAYQANLKKRFESLDKQLESLKNNFVKCDTMAKDTQSKNLGLASIVSLMDFVEHQELQTTVRGIVQTLHNVNTQTGFMGERVGSVCAIELERFQAKLKSLRQFVHSQRKENKKGMKKDGSNVYQYRSENDRARVIREKKKMEERIYSDLQDLKVIIDEYIHAQLLYHSKCFEAWARLYQKCKTISKESNKQPSNAQSQQITTQKRVLSAEDDSAGASSATSPYAGDARSIAISNKLKQKDQSQGEDDTSDEFDQEESTPTIVKTSISTSSLPPKQRFQSLVKKSVVLQQGGKRS